MKMPKKPYELEFDMWRLNGVHMLPQRVKIAADSREAAENRMRDLVYRQGAYRGRYVAFYPNGKITDSRIVSPYKGNPADLQTKSEIVSRKFHYGFGIKNYTERRF